jgi:hypothetical protein
MSDNDENIYKFICDQCNFFTNAKQAFDKHLNTNKHKIGKKATRSDKKYPEKCECCEYRPNSNRNYIQHKLTYHLDKEGKKKEFKFYCEKCDYGIYSDKLYEKHLNSKKHIKFCGN